MNEIFLDPRIKILKESKPGERPSWEEHGMVHAIAAATRSSCNHVRAGTAIAIRKTHGIIGTGYNGASSKIQDNCLKTGCRKELAGLVYEDSLGCGECIGIHSEINALKFSGYNQEGGLEIYTTIFPCHTCAKNLVPYTERLVFKRKYSEREFKQTMDHLYEAGIEVCQLDLSPERFIDIFFNQQEVYFDTWSREEKERIKEIFKPSQ